MVRSICIAFALLLSFLAPASAYMGSKPVQVNQRLTLFQRSKVPMVVRIRAYDIRMANPQWWTQDAVESVAEGLGLDGKRLYFNALNIHREAISTRYDDMAASYTVVQNRTMLNYGGCTTDVCTILREFAFSWTLKMANFDKQRFSLSLAMASILMEDPDAEGLYGPLRRRLMAEKVTHYHTNYVAPSWGCKKVGKVTLDEPDPLTGQKSVDEVKCAANTKRSVQVGVHYYLHLANEVAVLLKSRLKPVPEPQLAAWDKPLPGFFAKLKEKVKTALKGGKAKATKFAKHRGKKQRGKRTRYASA